MGLSNFSAICANHKHVCYGLFIMSYCVNPGVTLFVSLFALQASYPAWEDFVSKGTKLQSQLR